MSEPLAITAFEARLQYRYEAGLRPFHVAKSDLEVFAAHFRRVLRSRPVDQIRFRLARRRLNSAAATVLPFFDLDAAQVEERNDIGTVMISGRGREAVRHICDRSRFAVSPMVLFSCRNFAVSATIDA